MNHESVNLAKKLFEKTFISTQTEMNQLSGLSSPFLSKNNTQLWNNYSWNQVQNYIKRRERSKWIVTDHSCNIYSFPFKYLSDGGGGFSFNSSYISCAKRKCKKGVERKERVWERKWRERERESESESGMPYLHR